MRRNGWMKVFGLALAVLLSAAGSVSAAETAVVFDAATLASYPGQDLGGQAEVLSGGSELRLSGNTWKQAPLSYALTPLSVLAFEFRTGDLAEIHAIGLKTDRGDVQLRLAGSQKDWGKGDYDVYAGSDWRSFVVPLRKYLSEGSVTEIFFVCDNDAQAGGESVFRGVRLFELGETPITSGNVVRQVWRDVAGNGSLSNLTSDPRYPHAPDMTDLWPTFRAPVNWASYYGTRMLGLLTPPATGEYTFWIASDDNGELWLSSDVDPANKTRIARVPGYSSDQQWEKYPEQMSAPVMLQAGQSYYVEALQKEGSGGDNLAVAWAGPGFERQVIPGAFVTLPQDTSAPGAPGQPVATTLSDRVVRLSWAAAPDDVAIAGYRIYRGDEALGVSATPEFVDAGVAAATPYAYTVEAMDAAGNVSPRSVALELKTPAAPTPGSGTGLCGMYYDNVDFTERKLTRVDAGLDFNWGSSSPAPDLQNDTYSVRWEGELEPLYTQTTTLVVDRLDDGVRVWVAGKLVVDSWRGQSNATVSGSVVLTAGQRVPLRIDYYQGTGSSAIRLNWEGPSLPREVIPATQLYPKTPLLGTEVTFLTPVESRVSPAWVEGTVGEDAVSVSVSAGGASFAATRASRNRWFADSATAAGKPYGIELNAGAPVEVTVTATDSAGASGSAQQMLSWRPTVVGDPALPEVVIRAGDSLLLKVWQEMGGDNPVALDLDNDGTPDLSGVSVDGFVTAFSAGVHTVRATVAGQPAGQLVVRAVGIDWQGSTACEIGFQRIKDVRCSPGASDVVFASSDPYAMAVSSVMFDASTARLQILPLEKSSAQMQARLLSGTGPLLSNQSLDTFLVRTSASNRIPIIETFDDGSCMVEADVLMSPKVGDLTIKLHVFVRGVTFDDSTLDRVLSSDDMVTDQAGDGTIPYRMIFEPAITTGVCHTIRVEQNGVVVNRVK